MSDTIRLAVVGAGIMGANHVRTSKQLRDVELVAVVDPDRDRVAAATATTSAAMVGSIDDVIGHIDAAVLAVPTRYHVELAVRLAEAGVHVLVEKPLAEDVTAAQQIVKACSASGVVLAVGHVERFNAAVAELPKFLDEPIHVEATRVSPYSARVPDGVIFDLMIHDLDIVAALAGEDASVVDASGVARAVKGETEDLASVTMRFSTGLTATFNTSRLGQQKVRTIEITQADSVIVADLVRQDITIHRMTRHEYLSDEGSRYRQSSVVEIPFLESRGEPLALELQHFVECIRTGATPRVDGNVGVRALALAELAESVVSRS